MDTDNIHDAQPRRKGTSSTTWQAHCKACGWTSGNTSRRSEAEKRANHHNRTA